MTGKNSPLADSGGSRTDTEIVDHLTVEYEGPGSGGANGSCLPDVQTAITPV